MRMPDFNRLDIGQVGPVKVDNPVYRGPIEGTPFHISDVRVSDERGTVGIYTQIHTRDGNPVKDYWIERAKPQPKL